MQSEIIDAIKLWIENNKDVDIWSTICPFAKWHSRFISFSSRSKIGPSTSFAARMGICRWCISTTGRAINHYQNLPTSRINPCPCKLFGRDMVLMAARKIVADLKGKAKTQKIEPKRTKYFWRKGEVYEEK